MLALILILSLSGPGQKWVTLDTEIYRPLISAEVAVTTDGHIFIVNRDQCKILHYDSTGKKLGSFGAKGEGPGEMKTPTWIYLNENKIYVEDASTNSVNVFYADGRYIERIRLPQNGVILASVSNGWVYGDWASSKQGEIPAQLFWCDANFKNSKVIHSWTRAAEANKVTIQGTGGKKPVVPFNPAKEFAGLAVAPGGNPVYLIEHLSDDLHVIDVNKKAVVEVVKNNNRPIPFNTEWAATKLVEVKEGLPENIRNLVELKPNYPDHFPLVRDLAVSPNGLIRISLWTGRPEKDLNLQLIGPDLKPAKSPFSFEALDRTVGMRGDLCYILVFNQETEEAGIAGVHRDEANAFVAANPIIFDGLGGNSVITN